MLAALSIRDVVLIDRLDLDFAPGLCVLTGETGAGKSILLDSLGLALGVRAEQRLVRSGAENASVTAEFHVAHDHPACQIARDQGLDITDGDGLLLRRQLGVDGRSRAFINDQTVSVALLRQVGEALVEIHGQFESQRLLSPSVHRTLLDTHGGCNELADKTAHAFHDWRAAVAARERAQSEQEQARRDEEFLRHACLELESIAPQPGEETELADSRAMMMNGEKLIEAMNEAARALGQGGKRGDSAEYAIRDAIRHLESISAKAEGLLDPVIAALDRAAETLADGESLLQSVVDRVDLDPKRLEHIEERLFALRALARKHNVSVDNLADLLAEMQDKIAQLDSGGRSLEALIAAEREARQVYETVAGKLSAARKKAAGKLDVAVANELTPLRLGGAIFSTLLTPLAEADFGEHGCEKIAFQIATNAGAAPGPINKIASGGELSRFMLALKAVLAGADPVPTLVFDEVDAGIGGAVADAVGKRLAGLARDVQVLVVTHSPQVAAQGNAHYRVAKDNANGAGVRTTVAPLNDAERGEEIARMLAGENVTDEARAAAQSLLAGAGA